LIRDLTPKDTEALYRMLNTEVIGIDVDTIRNIYRNAKSFIVWDKGGIKGFAYILITNKEQYRWSIQLYVSPQERRKGIGTLLYKEVEKHVKNEKPSVLITEFRVDIDDPTPFYKRLDYKKWYGSPEMYFEGTTQPDVDLEFINYDDKYYEQYAKCAQDCFYEIRKENDIEPYIIPLSDEYRKNKLSEKDSIYLTFDNEHLVGAITIKGGYIDNIMVAPSYQGRGFGKKITQFGINKALSKGEPLIQLCYMEGNTKAESLYKSLGFVMVQHTHVYRRLL
jgi:ribosomal protein S18 acetylase RimI-like enzyme